MSDLLQNPVTYMAVLAAGSLIFGIGRWVGGVNADRKNLKDGFKDIAKEIREDIKKILIRMPGSTVESQSPAQLSEYGRQISRSMGAEEWARQLAPTLVHQVIGKPEYEVEEFCRTYARENLSTSSMVLKAMYDFGTTRDNVLAVPTIVLRDELLRVRPSRRSASGT